MASLFIQEYRKLGRDNQDVPAQAGYEPAVISQVVTYTSSTQSNAFDEATRFVRVISDTDCYLKFGTNPTATSTDMLVKANTVEFFCVEKGIKVAVTS